MAQREAAARAAGINPMFASDPELWKQAAAAQFRDPATATVGNVVIDTRTGRPIYTGQAEQPTSVREYEFYRQQAGPNALPYDQWDQARRRSGATSVNTGTIPQGYQLTTDPVTGAQRLEAIPGGPADKSAQDAAASESRATSTDVITGAADKIRDLAKKPGTTGLAGAASSYIPTSDAAEVYRQVDVLKSNATIENLNAMRQQSPTGGALGNVTEGEGKMLAAKSGALDPKSPHFQEQLDDYERTLLRIIHGKDAGDKIFDETRKAASPTSIPQGAIDMLRGDPSLATQFDAKYGQGAAARVLGGQ